MNLSCKHITLKDGVVFLWIAVYLFLTFSPSIGMSVEKFDRTDTTAQKEAGKGNVVNLYGKALGSVDPDGNITNLSGRPLGSIDKNGSIFNVSKILIGKVENDGKILNQSGTVLGSVDTEGNVFNVSGRKLGEIKDIEDIHLMGGAARLLLLKTR